jgi:hypothetical protein
LNKLLFLYSRRWADRGVWGIKSAICNSK